VVAHPSNYLGGRNWGGTEVEISPNKLSETHISIGKPDIVAHICDPRYVGGIGRKITVKASPGQNKTNC
jgi:hypothetical protein